MSFQAEAERPSVTDRHLLRSSCSEPIAIVGMGCRWPGGVSTESDLWEMLRTQRSGYREFSNKRINLDGFYHPEQHRPGSFYTRGGFFLDDDPTLFDHSLFGISPIETRSLDPAQRKLLEVTYEAFENAGEPWQKFAGSRTGVYVGNFNADHQNMQLRDADYPLPYATTGGGVAILSNRINYVFDLRGPSLTIDTACSSSMYALQLAVTGLRSGDCDSAIVAGSNLITDPVAQIFTTKLGAISPTSTCHTFDAAADGYARADGFGALYILRLSDAVEGEYPIRAVIRGIAINTNGRSDGISHPSATGQEAVIRDAYRNAGYLNPADTGYFECHGTGTAVGDPTEVSAIGKVFAEHKQRDYLYIGSIKPNLGHSESASAIASIMKAVLALEHGEIPPTRGIINLNPAINFKESRTKVVTDLTSWPPQTMRRVSVNSFGYGGANAHVRKPSRSKSVLILTATFSKQLILDHHSHTSLTCQTDAANGAQRDSCNRNGSVVDQTRRLVLLIFSAHNEHSLKDHFNAISRVSHQYQATALAYTLSDRRSQFAQRAFAVVPSNRISEALIWEHVAHQKSPSVAMKRIGFIFTGQGAQWHGMGAELMDEYATFGESIRYQDKVLTTLSKKPSWRIEDVLHKPELASQINKPQISQTVCTALQVALVDLLSSWMIKPEAVVGHSSGEIAAAYSAGRITSAEAIVLAYFRGLTVGNNKRNGGMLAVGLGPDDVLTYLAGQEAHVSIAAINSANAVTLSGDAAEIECISHQLQRDGVFNRSLQTGSNAYHSHHMAELGEEYESSVTTGLREIQHLIVSETLLPSILWQSSVRPRKDTTAFELGPSYWRENLESPVRFSDACEQLPLQTLDALLEIGPHPALKGSVKQILQNKRFPTGKSPILLSTLKRGGDALECMLELGGILFLNNFTFKAGLLNTSGNHSTGNVNAIQNSVCIGLPNYVYHYGPSILYENRQNREWRLRKYLRHDLLGARQAGGSKLYPTWRNMLRLKDVPWLKDHKLILQVTFPAAGFLAMAMEAAYQYHSETTENVTPAGYSFRNVSINSTLEIPDDEYGIEIIFHLQKVALTNSMHSSIWHEFKITSLQSDTESWTEHCNGLVCVETSKNHYEHISTVNEACYETLSAPRWYQKFAQLGLGYGPAFQGLSNLQAQPFQHVATADVNMIPTASMMNGESKYCLHPATLDTCLQLGLIAAHGGILDSAKSAFIPILIDRLSVWAHGAEAVHPVGYCVAKGELRGPRGVYGQAQLFDPFGNLIMDLQALKCVSYSNPLAGSDNAGASQNPFSRLVWRPDFEALGSAQAQSQFPPVGSRDFAGPIFEKLDRLSCYILVQLSLDFVTASIEPEEESLKAFCNWVHRCHTAARTGKISYGLEAVSASEQTRAETIEALFESLSEVVEANIIKRIYKNMPAILSSKLSGLQLTLADNLLTNLYISGIGISGAYPQVHRIIDLIAHKLPSMDILEIGAGTGGTTRLVLQTLASEQIFRRYRSYVFTDVTSAFFAAAEREFAGYAEVVYRKLNIEQDPVKQGFTAGGYDLIIASQVLHATRKIAETVINARKLLKAGGKMVLLELTRTHLATGLVLGTLPDYWNGVNDGRADSPLLSKEMWHDALLRNGFSGIDLALNDYPEGINTASVLVTTAIEPKDAPMDRLVPKERVFLLTNNEPTSFAHYIEESLLQRNLEPVLVSVSDARVPKGARVVSIIGLEDPATLFRVQKVFEGVKSVLREASSILWLSIGGLVSSPDPELGLDIGFWGTIAREFPLVQFAHLVFSSNIEHSRADADIVVGREARLHLERGDEASDTLQLVHDGCLYISRIVPDSTLNSRFKIQNGIVEETRLAQIGSLEPVKADFKLGRLSSLRFQRDLEFGSELGDDWVEIKTEAMGLNIKDLAVATGHFDWNNFSTECCGIISKVGAQVKELQPGDRVVGAVPGNFGNFVRAPAFTVQKVNKRDKPEQMASLPVSYMTAVYALLHLAHLNQGETVLIQSATGGLGLAAMRIAQHLRAEIYATVGNASKVDLLVGEFGIPRDHIFNSREISTYQQIWQMTGGKGIDVILCSAGAEHLREAWRCIAPMGRFIDVGRTDVLNRGNLPLEGFERNATFTSFDLGLMNRQKPQTVGGLMKQIIDMYRQGIIKPIDFITTFDISELEQAMMYMSKGIHVGKIVITFRDPKSKLKVLTSAPRTSFSSSATYILVGCLGGLGQTISSWMADRGARHLVHLSRSMKQSSAVTVGLEKLSNRGVDVKVIPCDVTVKDEVFAVIKKCSKDRKVRGVLHAAAVFEDVNFESMTFAQMQKVLAPKVQGTINLHEATLTQPLDFFTMTSSIVTLVGTATQSAYSAANAFQDAFARMRVSRSLPAQALAFGMILDVGFASSRPEIQRALTRNGVYGTTQPELLRVLDIAFASSPSIGCDPVPSDPLAGAHLLCGLEPSQIHALDPSHLGAEFVWARDRRFAYVMQGIRNYHLEMQRKNGAAISGQGGGTGADELFAHIDKVKARGQSSPEDGQSLGELALSVVVERLAKLLFLPLDEIDVTRNMESFGIDSMIGVELRSWLAKTFGLNIRFADLVAKGNSPKELANQIIEKLLSG
ncbi:hypothetical protein EV356DRAFT_448529 [Viridothelium virens]|uniref:Uncharacterized protein n=1 Tax=Viridothelium virens TaxID=1048519 RepID=A0A6A6H5S4_VIRVR|nr:hypothetical protein EV356DRAFT_448529 [Viridothelium virens]